jgi:hypothetical protein
MSNGLFTPTMLTSLATLAVLADLAWHLSLAVERTRQPGSVPRLPAENHHDIVKSSGAPGAYFSIWTFDGIEWGLLEPCGQEGCDCGIPPARLGGYEGEVIRKECPRVKAK